MSLGVFPEIVVGLVPAWPSGWPIGLTRWPFASTSTTAWQAASPTAAVAHTRWPWG